MPEASETTAPHAAPSGRPILPPYVSTPDFLDEGLVAELLDFAVSREAAFRPARVVGSVVKPMKRRAWTMSNLPRFGPLLRERLLERLPGVIASLGASPVADPDIGLELVAYRDGDFFERHVDTQARRFVLPTSPEGEARLMVVLSGVYYFHRQPKGFSGGALRLYPVGPPRTDVFADVEPAHNRLVVFPSWALHEVTRVSCPSGRFDDSRFSINYFVRQQRRPL